MYLCDIVRSHMDERRYTLIYKYVVRGGLSYHITLTYIYHLLLLFICFSYSLITVPVVRSLLLTVPETRTNFIRLYCSHVCFFVVIRRRFANNF